MAAPSGWEPVERVPTYELVLRRIEEQLISRTLRPGDRLPPERELATMLGASRPAVREALRVLQAQGVVRSAVGTRCGLGHHRHGGAFGRADQAAAGAPGGGVVPAVGCRRGPGDVRAVQRAGRGEGDHPGVPGGGSRRPWRRWTIPDIDRARFNELDTEFHVAIAEAGGNRFIADLTVAVRESIRTDILGTLEETTDWSDIRDGLRADHHAIYQALAAADGPRAADLLEAHINGFYTRMRVAPAEG